MSKKYAEKARGDILIYNGQYPMYELKLEKFSGPLEKLLELIEEQKLDVNEVSMANVTDDFLKYLDEFRKEGAHAEEFRADLRLLADFIAVASRLIFLKSKYLLPNIPFDRGRRSGHKRPGSAACDIPRPAARFQNDRQTLAGRTSRLQQALFSR